MKSFRICIAVLALIFSASLARALPQDTLRFQPTKQSIEVVVTRMLDRLGADALSKVSDRTCSGTITYHSVDSTVSGKIIMVSAAPNMKHDLVNINGKTIEHFVDGKHAWLKPDTLPARAITGKALTSDLEDAMFNPELHLLDSGTTLTLLGTDQLDSLNSAYVLKVEFKNTPAELWYVSTNSWLILQRSKQVGSRVLQIRYSDFRTVDGVTYPFKYDLTGLENYSLSFDSIRNNTHPDQKEFSVGHR